MSALDTVRSIVVMKYMFYTVATPIGDLPLLVSADLANVGDAIFLLCQDNVNISNLCQNKYVFLQIP